MTALVTLVRSAKDPRTRLHALWTLDGIDAIDPATVTAALEDASRDVRASAIRVAERWLGEAGHPMQAAVLKRLDDPDWAVRQQLAASLGALPPGARETAVVALLERYGDDPIVMDAALSGIRGSEAAVLERLIRSAGRQTPQREAAVTTLAAMREPTEKVNHVAARVARPGTPAAARGRGRRMGTGIAFQTGR